MFKRTAILQALTNGLTYQANTAPVPNASGSGYYAGGSGPGGVLKSIDRLDFSTEACARLSALLASARQFASGYQSPTKGYVVGQTTSIESLAFSTEATGVLSASTSSAREYGAATQSQTKGYLGGGGWYSAVIDRLLYSTEANTLLSATLAKARNMLNTVCSDTKGIFVSGFNGTFCYDTDDFTFSTETRSATGSLPVYRRRIGATVQSATRGYLCGGITVLNEGTSTYGDLAEIDSVVLSTNTWTKLSAVLSTTKNNLSGTSSKTKGYLYGGAKSYPGGPFPTSVDSLAFATETSSVSSAVLPAAYSVNPAGLSHAL